MQDPRIRLLCAFLLSLAAFASVTGAGAVFIWWLAFTPRWHSIRHRTAILATLVLFVIVAGVMTLAGSDGLSYLVRMTAILLVGTWVYAESCTGDFLSVGTWLFGTRIGFEAGMIAGMAMQMATGLFEDFRRIRIATGQKGQSWSIRSVVPAGRVLIYDALVRADDTAEVLVMRGYRNGGTCCPRFHPSLCDVVAGTCAIVALILAYIPVSEFFILYR
jgi:energy-coupling factor transport system permease protein